MVTHGGQKRALVMAVLGSLAYIPDSLTVNTEQTRYL